jgi:hypothetical protein
VPPHELPFDDDEPSEVLRQRLADCWARRTLTGAPISLEHQSDAANLLSSERLSCTTGQALTEEGGPSRRSSGGPDMLEYHQHDEREA